MTDATAISADGTPIAYRTLGEGRGLVILGGSLRSAKDYLPLAEDLAGDFQVHVLDRRGRGRSGPLGADYGLERELEDLRAVQAATGATAIFGHSYGGLIALEFARRESVFSDVLVYEPGISVAGSIPSAWLDEFGRRLDADDARGAFTTMVRGAGGAPPALSRVPFWLARRILTLAFRGAEWDHLAALLPAQAREHAVVAAADEPSLARFATVNARVQVLRGGDSPGPAGARLASEVERVIPHAGSQVIDGLGHTGPDDDHGHALVATAIAGFLAAA